jgi:hypothetical protein
MSNNTCTTGMHDNSGSKDNEKRRNMRKRGRVESMGGGIIEREM